MRKMTKTVAVLAAMSAMTVASASLACAATPQLDNVSAVSDNKEAAESAAVVGTWGQDNAGKWFFTKEDGKKLKNTWAKIDGIWYYFDGETMAQDSFLIIDENGYFFDDNGRMAAGWQKITSKMDAYSDISIADELYYPTNNAYTQVDEDHEYDYHDFVWCYFDEKGVAKENEWFQDTDGKWYYFDGNVMVKNVFDYQVRPDNYDATTSNAIKYYGFDENGAMLVGWNSKKTPSTWNNPTADAKGDVWYYYKSNGQMQKAGWAEIDGAWYLFAEKDDDGKAGDNDGTWNYGGYPLIVNSYVASYKSGSGVEYFYVDKKGKLQTGVQNVRKAWKVMFYDENKTINVAYEQLKVADKDIYVNFADKGYAAKEAIVDDSYYTMATDNIVKAEFGDTKTVRALNNKLLDATLAFNNYDSIKANAWSFTDAGSAVDSTTSDADEAVAYYVHNETFEKLSVADYNDRVEAGLSVSNYFALPVLDENPAKDKAELARVTANDYYHIINGGATPSATYKIDDVTYNANSPYNLKQAKKDAQDAWLAAVGAATVAVTGYNDADLTTDLAAYALRNANYAYLATDYAALNAGWGYNNLVLKTNSLKAARDVADLAYQLALSNGASASIVDERKEAYDFIDAVATAYENALENAKGDAEVAAVIDDNAVLYNAWKNACKAYDNAVTVYNVQAAYVKSLNYKYFENKWDQAETITSIDKTNFAVVGELVKNAFIGRKDDLYVADADGEFVTSKAILIDRTAGIVHRDGLTYQNAYILLGSDGKAVRGYEATKKSITIGGVTYWATDKTFTLGKASATVFVANKIVDGQY